MSARYLKWWIYRGDTLVATLMQTDESRAIELAVLMTQLPGDELVAQTKERK